jgi:copper chaperone NosL
MIKYKKENPDKEPHQQFVHDFPKNNVLIPAETAFYIKSSKLKSPMAGNIAAFKTESEVKEYQTKLQAEKTDWATLNR